MIKRWDFSTGQSRKAGAPAFLSCFGQALLHNLKSVTYLDLISQRSSSCRFISQYLLSTLRGLGRLLRAKWRICFGLANFLRVSRRGYTCGIFVPQGEQRGGIKGPGVMGQIPTNDLLLSHKWMLPPHRAVVTGEYDKGVQVNAELYK